MIEFMSHSLWQLLKILITQNIRFLLLHAVEASTYPFFSECFMSGGCLQVCQPMFPLCVLTGPQSLVGRLKYCTSGLPTQAPE